jgi:DNA-binding LytR/AlgR family response regulator
MKVIIVEDEKPAADKLEQMIKNYDPEIEISGKFGTIEKTVEFLNIPGNHPDLMFMDIQLTDGLSFEIFDKIDINTPVIFITAYNEYAIRAFKVNSIDYLLKPLSYDDFYRSMEKIKSLRENLPFNRQRLEYEELGKALLQLNKSYKTRFMIKVGDHIKSVKTENISLFYAEGRTVYLLTNKQNKYIVDFRLEELELCLVPVMFFRPNRSFIININAIKDVIVYSNSRLKIILNWDFDKEIIVSRDKVFPIKVWLDGAG